MADDYGDEKASALWGWQDFHLLVNAVIDYAMYMLDLDGHVVSWNPGAVRLKGYSEEEIIGQSFARFYTPEDLQAGVPQKALRVARETGRFEAEAGECVRTAAAFGPLS